MGHNVTTKPITPIHTNVYRGKSPHTQNRALCPTDAAWLAGMLDITGYVSIRTKGKVSSFGELCLQWTGPIGTGPSASVAKMLSTKVYKRKGWWYLTLSAKRARVVARQILRYLRSPSKRAKIQAHLAAWDAWH